MLLPTVVLFTFLPATVARADDPSCDQYGRCEAKAEKRPREPAPAAPVAQPKKNAPAKATKSENRKIALRIAMEVAAYEAALTRFQHCLIGPGAANCSRPSMPGLTDDVTVDPSDDSRPAISPQQAAYLAVAQLQLPSNAPGIGPDPKKNEWKMAAVGYPLWLWSDGPTHIGPVSQSVANLSVSLDARVSKTVFQMGDGKTVTCRSAGTPYKSWVRAGAKSPDCGYVYTKPSLPGGKYKVGAVSYWAVTWRVNGVSGVITVPRRGEIELPVGELHAVIVR